MAASASRTKNVAVPSSGSITPKASSARTMMAPPAHGPELLRTGLVGSPGELVVACTGRSFPRGEERGSARRAGRLAPQIGGKAAQVREHVHVVKGLAQAHRQSESSRAGSQSVEGVATPERCRVE